MSDRRILRISGPEARDFLQGLVTNDVARLKDGLVYAALLTAQGKYLSDFFLAPGGAAVLLDAPAAQGDMLVQRLSTYKLRADVQIEEAGLHLHRGLSAAPQDGFADPRHESLGWRAYRDTAQQGDDVDWDALRVTHLVPESGVELTPETFILEAGFERLHGVDFRKGCYVGQEVTARMKHKTELKKGLVRVAVMGEAAPGTEIFAGEKPAGVLFTQSGGAGIAYLRFNRATGEMAAEDAQVLWDGVTAF